MTTADVAIMFFTIVYGLMLTDLFLSLHRLLRAKGRVRWHGLPLLAAWYLFVTILRNWWGLAFMQGEAEWMNLPVFLVYGHLLLLFFLLASAVLPDEVGEDGVCLRTHYFATHRYFWGLMAATVLLSNVLNAVKTWRIGQWETIGPGHLINGTVFLGLTVVLAVSNRPRVHWTLLSLFVAGLAAELLL